ncbi:MAG: Nif3-like dinuclear metal center hexameric protein [Coriobacteriia bacterium]
MSSERTVKDLATALDRRFPKVWAEEWDNVGLIVGDGARRLTGVLVTLDATAQSVRRTAESGANVLLTHHPPYLGLPETVRAMEGPAGTLEAALRLGIAVVTLHTNLDRSPEGATALPALLGMTVVSALEDDPERVAVIVTYVPPEAADNVRGDMAAAGAGRVGRYERCAFLASGTGVFSPLPEAMPAVEDCGDGVRETRIEMIAPPSAVAQVLEAARAAHPYEEPVILAADALRARGIARMGRVCTWREGGSLSDLAEHTARVLGCTCRVWGDPSHPAGRVAVGGGSGGALVSAASRAADTLLVGELRYHDALAATAAGLGIIEAGHDTTEWPLVRVLAQAVSAWDPTILLREETASLAWWTTEGTDDRG